MDFIHFRDTVRRRRCCPFALLFFVNYWEEHSRSFGATPRVSRFAAVDNWFMNRPITNRLFILGADYCAPPAAGLRLPQRVPTSSPLNTCPHSWDKARLFHWPTK